jgi:hypothetical protein
MNEQAALNEQPCQIDELAGGDRAHARQLRKDRRRGLAEAMARGVKAAEWARENGVAESTAYRWAAKAQVKAAVREARRRALEELVGLSAEDHRWSVDGIKALARDASSEAVRLAAYKSFQLDVFKLVQYAQVHDQMKAIEEKILGRKNAAHGGQGPR